MDLDDLLEDLLDDLGLDDAVDDVRDRLRGRRDERRERRRDRREEVVEQARRTVAEGTRMPGVRARLRAAALWGSAAWASVFGAGGLAFGLATLDGLTTVGPGDVAGVALTLVALPAVPVGVWAWRTRDRDRAQKRQEAARRTARQERTELPADVVGDWKRLRQAQALVSDLAEQGLVEPTAVAELGVTAEQLRQLLVADHRASQLGGTPSGPLREQVADLADLLVAMAVEGVEHRAGAVGAAHGPATLREATDRLESLRSARAEVARTEATATGRPDLGAPPHGHRDDRRDDERGGDRPRPTPG